MKKIFYLIILLSVLTQSCVDQASDDIVYTIFNQTDKNVKVLGFIRDFDNPENSTRATPINIAPNMSFKVTRINGLDDDTGKGFYSFYGVDSVRVIFNNEKVQVLTSENTFNQGQTIFIGDKNHQHFITANDYNSAEDCNGNCD